MFAYVELSHGIYCEINQLLFGKLKLKAQPGTCVLVPIADIAIAQDNTYKLNNNVMLCYRLLMF